MNKKSNFDNLTDQAKWQIKNQAIQVSLVTTKLEIQLGSVLLIILFGTLTFISFINLQGSFLFFTLSTFLLSLIAFSDYWKSKFYKVSRSERELIRKMERFIKTNHLYIREEGYIIDSVLVTFKFCDKKLIVKLIAKGSKFTNRIGEMDEELQSVLNLELIDKKQTLTSTDYFFQLMRPMRINYGEFQDNTFKAECNAIKINSEISWNMTKAPHALIAGGTGGGKTYFLFHLIYSLVKMDANIFISDPKQSDLYNLRNSKAINPKQVQSDTNKICRQFRVVKEEMDGRYKEIALNNQIGATFKDCHMEPIILIVDELAAFSASCNKKEETEAMDNLRQIIFKGRQAGVFVILATQKPEAEAIPTAIRDQLGLRVVLGNLSDDGYRMTFGKQNGFKYYSSLPGEGYIYIVGEVFTTPQRFQAPHIENLQNIVNKMDKIYKINSDKS